MVITKETCQMCVNRLPENIVEKDDVEHALWIVPAPLSAMLLINDAPLQPDEAASEMDEVSCGQRIRPVKRDPLMNHPISSPTVFFIFKHCDVLMLMR